MLDGNGTNPYHERLTADNAAMVLIDHQTGTMLLGVTDVNRVEFRNNAVALARAARLHDLPTTSARR